MFKLKILSKLSGEVADKVSSYMIEMQEKSTVPTILDILKQEILTMEIQQIAENLSTTVPNREDKELRSSVPSSEKTKYQYHCMFCMVNGHDSSTCRKFGSPKDYQQFLCRHGLCFNCLQKGHVSYDCPQSSQCNCCEDRRKHSQVMCFCYHERLSCSAQLLL